jgi:uncharacterized protein YndB with AHSA1/START domain
MTTKRNRQWVRTLAFAVAGFGAGAVFGGGRFVRTYDWETEWQIDAPLPEVYHAMTDPEEQFRWWPNLIIKRVTSIPGTSEGHTLVGEIHQTGSAGRLAPPFQLVSSMTALEKDRRSRSIVSGDLVGVMESFFSPRADGGTRIVFYWYVRVHNPLLNALGGVLEPSFRASHDRFMCDGEVGLQAYCQQRLPVAI